MKRLAFILPALFLASACTQHPEFSVSGNGEELTLSPTELRVIDKNRAPIPANCLLQNGAELNQITTPVTLKLPVSEKALGDIQVTCEVEGQKRTAVLKSRLASAQRNVLVDTSSGEALIVNEFNNEAATSGLDNVSDLLALGLSTNVIAGNFYVYPSLVVLSFK